MGGLPWPADGGGNFYVEGLLGRRICCSADFPLKELNGGGRASTTAVLCHGLFSHRFASTLQVLSRCLLHPSPVVDVVIRVDFHGCGDSDETGCAWSLGGYEDEAEDLAAVTSFLKSHGCVVVLIAGHSRGGTVVPLFVSRHPELCPPVLILHAARWNLREGLYAHFDTAQRLSLEKGEAVTFTDRHGKLRTVTPRCIQRRETLDMAAIVKENAAAFSKCRYCLLIAAAADSVVPFDDAVQMFTFLKANLKIPSVDLLELTHAKAGHSIACDDAQFKKCFRAKLPSIATAIAKTD